MTVCGLASVCAGCGQAGPGGRAPLRAARGSAASSSAASHAATGAFAGYLWRGRETSVAASWVVPAITPRSGVGRAGSWIGAAGPSTREPNPFIQVGTNEESLTAPGGSSRVYYAFWSDNRHDFHPVRLFGVRPGDEISARLTMGRRRPRVSIVDTTSSEHSSFSTSDLAGDAFNQAQWFQEDITDVDAHKPFPYPDLSTMRFRDLAVNSTRPRPARLYSSWMSVNGEELATTPVRDDSFSLRPTTIRPSGVRYLQIADVMNSAASRYEVAIGRWLRGMPRTHIGSATITYSVAVRHALDELADQHWPEPTQPFVDALIRAHRASLRATGSPVSVALGHRRAWVETWLRPLRDASRIAQRIRHALGLPDIEPNH